MARILIVDDQRGMRDALRAILQESGHAVAEADNGRTALSQLQSGSEFDLVITDGLELLAWIKANKSLPVIFVTGFTHILETKQAYVLGADDFMTKPFSPEEILASVDRILGLKAKSVEQLLPDRIYCRIPIEDFVSSSGVQIGVYIRLAAQKFVRVAHKGDLIPAECVEHYRSKGLEYLYAHKEEFARLVGFSLEMSKMIQGNKTRFLEYTSQLILEQSAINGFNPETVRQAADCLALCVEVVSESQNLFDLLCAMSEHGDWIYRHSLSVGIVSVMIGRKVGWTGQATMFKLSAGGLFHDLGEKELDQNLLVRHRASLSFEERKMVETHPSRGKQILEELNELPEDIVQIVHQHHEDCTGRGFPRQLSKEKIHPLAKVISVADRFCTLAMPSPRGKGSGAKEAIERTKILHESELDRAAFAALQSLVK